MARVDMERGQLCETRELSTNCYHSKNVTTQHRLKLSCKTSFTRPLYASHNSSNNAKANIIVPTPPPHHLSVSGVDGSCRQRCLISCAHIKKTSKNKFCSRVSRKFFVVPFFIPSPKVFFFVPSLLDVFRHFLSS